MKKTNFTLKFRNKNNIWHFFWLYKKVYPTICHSNKFSFIFYRAMCTKELKATNFTQKSKSNPKKHKQNQSLMRTKLIQSTADF